MTEARLQLVADGTEPADQPGEAGVGAGVVGDAQWLAAWAARAEPSLISVRRRIHANPELGRQERATTNLVREQLERAGRRVSLMSYGSGLWCDIGSEERGPTVLLRADLDALPIGDEKDVVYRSRIAGVAHCCGHDVHTTAVLGAGLALAELDRVSPLPGRVRLLFQPAEEIMPGGALDVVAAGGLAGVDMALGLHCDPTVDLGQVGVRSGPITGAADNLEVRLTGPGGHTSRPQRTVDLVYALGRVVTDVPGLLSRLADPRAGLSLVWGAVGAGVAANAIPDSGFLRGTVRMLDKALWDDAPALVERLIRDVVRPLGAQVEVEYRRGVPPVVNAFAAAEVLRVAADRALGEGSAVATEQSLGGEDFAWYLEHVPGAMARLGTRTPGGQTYDLHQGRFDVDERCVGVGVRLMAGAALEALTHLH